MKVNPYLNFDGKTEEAFNFYKSVFGGEFSALQRFKDVPAEAGTAMPASEVERIMHVALPIGDGQFLMGSDISPSRGHTLTKGNNVYVSLHPTSKEEADRLFAGLSAGGTIELALQKMFWGDYFGSFADKFGIRWMINYHEA
jgi:PhnB protein